MARWRALRSIRPCYRPPNPHGASWLRTTCHPASYRLVESAPENLSPVADPPIYLPALADLRASWMHFDEVAYIPEPPAEPAPEFPADAGWSDDRGLTAIEDAAAARDAAEDARAAMPAGSLPAVNLPAPLPEPAPIEAPRVPRPMAVTLSG